MIHLVKDTGRPMNRLVRYLIAIAIIGVIWVAFLTKGFTDWPSWFDKYRVTNWSEQMKSKPY